MRELSTLELSVISAGEKTVSEMKPSEFLPYVVAAGAAKWTWDFVGTWGVGENAMNAHALYFLQTFAGTAALVAGGFVATWVADKVQSQL